MMSLIRVDRSRECQCHVSVCSSQFSNHCKLLSSGICCQFDFPRMSNSHPYKGCPWGVNPQPITPSNVAEKASELLDQYRKKSTLYRTRQLLVPIGNDFEFMQPEFANNQFSNYQQLFDHMNAQPELNVHARFATLHEYFTDTKKWIQDHPGDSLESAVPGTFI